MYTTQVTMGTHQATENHNAAINEILDSPAGAVDPYVNYYRTIAGGTRPGGRGRPGTGGASRTTNRPTSADESARMWGITTTVTQQPAEQPAATPVQEAAQTNEQRRATNIFEEYLNTLRNRF